MNVETYKNIIQLRIRETNNIREEINHTPNYEFESVTKNELLSTLRDIHTRLIIKRDNTIELFRIGTPKCKRAYANALRALCEQFEDICHAYVKRRIIHLLNEDFSLDL